MLLNAWHSKRCEQICSARWTAVEYQDGFARW
jgi:hypothetical protein